MSQKIPAFYYIKNNKRRVSVLVVSLAMFFIITYMSMFLLSTTSETFRSVLTESTKYIQYILLTDKDLDIDAGILQDGITEEDYMDAVNKKYNSIKGDFKKCKGIEDVFIVQTEYAYVTSIVGNYYIEIPMTNKKQMDILLKHMGAELADGRLPEKEDEVVLDRKIIKNHGYKKGDTLNRNSDVKIVGIIECDYYFGCGIANNNKTFTNPELCVVTDGTVHNLEKTIEKQGVILENSEFIDLANGEKKLQDEIIDTISGSTNFIFAGIMVIVAILVVIVNISYMRDRRSEWCLYSSIGYSRKAVYYSILREMLFVFVTALLTAAVVSIILMKLLDIFLITELGLTCLYFIPETLIEILCAYIALFGILQIPVRFEIYKIKTIDAIDDDM
ncbi:MAG: ABC transporter permease [Lachnospiraceae bacterium]|jgi:ABC-type antimicrobial peptide transport system permease subunit|nr:ABC transporter permease [Lachnospiraceae bacterium]